MTSPLKPNMETADYFAGWISREQLQANWASHPTRSQIVGGARRGLPGTTHRAEISLPARSSARLDRARQGKKVHRWR